MADLQRMDRTWLCSVLFMDIANYSSQSVEQQMKWKTRFNGYLAEAIQDVPKDERVILDTGDGAAVCFLGSPEAAMFAALHLWQCFTRDAQEQQPGLRVRLGVNLGPVKLVKDLNGSLNAIGDGMNAGQRIMSFAPENQILASQSFFEVVSRLSDDYKALFKLKGVETDKHVREHTVYSLLPPGSTEWRASAAAESQPEPDPAAARDKPHKRSPALLLIGGALVIVIAAVAVWRFAGSGRSPAGATVAPLPEASVPAAARTAYDQGVRLIDQDKAAQALQRFDEAIRADPNYVLAYLGRAEAHRKLGQFETSIEDCTQAMRIKPDEPRTHFCRGIGEEILKQFDLAVRDYSEAIRLNPDFALAYESRGDAYNNLQQYNRAIEDLNQAIRLRPNDALAHLRRAVAYENLKQYAKAIQDYDQAIHLQPGNARAYNARANVKQLQGDGRGAAADRSLARQLKAQ